MSRNALINHLRCFAFLFENHSAVHFLAGFALTVLFSDESFSMALLAGALVCVITGFLNLLTYFWRHRYRPEQLVAHHLSGLLERHRHSGEASKLVKDLECLAQAPYLNPSQRERVAMLQNQLHLQSKLPAWHLRYQLEQLLHI